MRDETARCVCVGTALPVSILTAGAKGTHLEPERARVREPRGDPVRGNSIAGRVGDQRRAGVETYGAPGPVDSRRWLSDRAIEVVGDSTGDQWLTEKSQTP